MLGKQAIRVVQSDQRGFVSQIFLVPKKDGGHKPVINLKALNKFIVEEHFKMEGFCMVKDLKVNCNAKFLLLKYVYVSMQCTKQQFL